METQFKRNEFQTFYAKIKIRLGGEKNSYSIEKDDEFEFDGTVCKYAGMEFSQPGLRGAINRDWATKDQNDHTPIQSQRPSRDIASAVSVNRDLSRVHRQNRDSVPVDSLDEDTVLEVSDRKAAMQDPRRGSLTKSDNRRIASRGLSFETSELDTQDGTVVSRLKTPTKAVVDVVKNPNRARELEMASYDDGYGRAEIVEGVSIRTNIGNLSNSIESDLDESENVVGRVRNTSSTSVEGIEVRDTSNIRNKEGNRRKVVSPTVEAIESSLPTGSKLEVARAVYSAFPGDWNFFAKLDDKLQRIESIGPNKQLIKALLAAESKSLVKVLKEKYPKFVA